jgi:hypothetical protein
MRKPELIASVVGIAKANGYTMTEEQIGLLSKLTVKRIHERFCLLVWGHFGALTATDEEVELFNFAKEYDAHTGAKLAVEMARQF